MRRVTKQEVQCDPFIKPDGLEYCLSCWKVWMQTDDRNLSASRMKFEGGDDKDGKEDDSEREKVAYESDPYEEQRKADGKIGLATDAMIESMPRLHVWAIYRMCSISTQWNFPNAAFQDVAEAASNNLRNKLCCHSATAILF